LGAFFPKYVLGAFFFFFGSEPLPKIPANGFDAVFGVAEVGLGGGGGAVDDAGGGGGGGLGASTTTVRRLTLLGFFFVRFGFFSSLGEGGVTFGGTTGCPIVTVAALVDPPLFLRGVRFGFSGSTPADLTRSWKSGHGSFAISGVRSNPACFASV